MNATIVMYHVVHPAGPGVIGRFKGIGVEDFRGQLAYIQRHYSPVRLSDLVDASQGRRDLPRQALVLTFDDAYASHYRVVFPVLQEAGVPATFFPVSSSLLDGTVLDVNKIQSILAAADDPGAIAQRIDEAIERERPRLPPAAQFRSQWCKASRWDRPEVVYVKRLLQHALPEDVRQPLVDSLFREFVTADEGAFAAELYMTVEQAREMRQAGMTIGAHGDRHLRLSTLTRVGQALEIDGALRVLDAVGLPRRDFVYSYANGEYNADSIELLGERGCRAAVTTHPDLARVDKSEAMAWPRIDTNDLPVRADAAPNDWTRSAYS